MKKFYTVYKITNTINGKIYIGAHKTSDLEDGYMGSGKVIKRAIIKYGLENFTKEYLHIFENSEDMFKMESVIVNEDFINDKNTYNIKIGGYGGFDYINSNGLNKNGDDFNWYLEKLKDADFRALDSAMKKERIKRLFDEGIVKPFVGNEFKGKHHTDDTKRKIGEANAKHQKGKGNSQYGKIWIYNLEEKINKTIKKEELPGYEKIGWLKGRKMKFIKE